jgi:nucleoside-diphosphate-sugar epimerase
VADLVVTLSDPHEREATTMRIAVTGHTGYIGTVLVPMLLERGHEVLGIDSELFAGCEPLAPLAEIEDLRLDVREVQPEHLDGCQAVMHLAAVSNDPMGDLHPDTTYDINERATVQLAQAAKVAGVERFLFSSSCSLYGAALTEAPVDEQAPFNPVTAYGRAKVLAEQGLRELADDGFTPVYLRNATAYGYSPRLRLDLVVNNLTARAVATGEVRLQSDGTPWRPLVHVEDISRAFLALLDAPREVVHDQAFNVGRSDENYRIREVAELVGERVEGSRISFEEGAGPDKRSYRVDFSKIADLVPAFEPKRTVPEAISELRDHLAALGLGEEALFGARFVRLERLKELLESGHLDEGLRWRSIAARA